MVTSRETPPVDGHKPHINNIHRYTIALCGLRQRQSTNTPYTMSSESGSDGDNSENWSEEEDHADAEFSEEDEALFGQDNRVVYFSKLRRVEHNDPSGHDYLSLGGKALNLGRCELEVEDLRVLMVGLRQTNSLRI
eukprot:scaffold730_cov206-Alexandrium_tamarense.AAC.16